MPTAEPTIEFGHWVRWKDRKSVAGDQPKGGVYLFGYFVGDQPADVPKLDDLPYEVIYVGDAKNLTHRPLSGVHHKISRYRRLFEDGSLDRLYVSVAPLYDTACVDYAIQRTASTYVEAMLIWKFACQHGHPPVIAVKEGGEETDYLEAALKRLTKKARA